MAFVEHGPTISICASVSGCLLVMSLFFYIGLQSPQITSFELMEAALTICSISLRLIVIYRMPPTFDFVQHIDKPTHNSGHLLDYIITRKDSSGVSNVYVSDFYL